jgi:adaptin ear-binding coat-associated protein 1/2
VQVIDAAVDSSRYFALRIENPETRSHVFIGVGFSDHEVASQLKLTLSEHGRYLARRRRALQEAAAGEEPAAAAAAGGTSKSGEGGAVRAEKDLSLQGSIKVALPRGARASGARALAPGNGAGGSAVIDTVSGDGGTRLAPPPSRARRSQQARGSLEGGAHGSGHERQAHAHGHESGVAKAATVEPDARQAAEAPTNEDNYGDDDFGDFVG